MSSPLKKRDSPKLNFSNATTFEPTIGNLIESQQQQYNRNTSNSVIGTRSNNLEDITEALARKSLRIDDISGMLHTNNESAN